MNFLASLFHLAGPDLIIILIIVLLIFGARKLPEMGRGLGEMMGEFSKDKAESDDQLTRSQARARASSDDSPPIRAGDPLLRAAGVLLVLAAAWFAVELLHLVLP